MFIGEKGQMFADYNGYKLYPEDKFKDFKAPPPTIPPSIGHWKEWIQGLQGRRPHYLQLRLLRCVDRGRALGQRCLSDRQETAMGRPGHEGHQLP